MHWRATSATLDDVSDVENLVNLDLIVDLNPILSHQREWRDKVFHVENVVQRGVFCRANARSTTALFGHASPTGVTKRARSKKN